MTTDSTATNDRHGTRLCALLITIVVIGSSSNAAARGREKEPAEYPPPSDDGTATQYQELPHWPLGFIPKCLVGTKSVRPNRDGTYSGRVLAWLPPKAKRIRALFIIPNNSDSKHIGEHEPIKEVAKKHEMAIIYLRSGDVAQLQPILDELAERTGIKEFRHAPWIPQGKSSRGEFPIRLMWKYPKRTIAGLTYHGETPPWPPGRKDYEVNLQGETMLHLNANGESEWGGTWFKHARPALLNYREHNNWLPHVLAAKGVGHGDYPDANGSEGWGKKFPDRVTCIDVWDYFAVYMDKALSLRLPKGYPTDEPIELRQVDETKGYLIDPFAIEELFRVPHYPLVREGDRYLAGGASEPPTEGFLAVAPEKDCKPAEGVPVVPLVAGKAPSNWLRTQHKKVAMQNDPKKNLCGLDKLRPAPGDTVKIDDWEAKWMPIEEKRIGDGGISLAHMKNWGEKLSLLAYTVVKAGHAATVQLIAPYSVAGRSQVVLAGVPIEHKQVVALQPGLYPMLVVLSLDGPNWGTLGVKFDAADDELVQVAKEYTKKLEVRAAEQARIDVQGVEARPLIRPYADVPGAERKHMFWVADREQAEAWFKVHAIHGQKFDVP